MKNNALLFKLNSIYFIFYGITACFYPFITLYFTSRGLPYSRVGIALALNSLVGVIIQPIWGFFTDKYLNKKLSLLITISSSCILAPLFVLVKTWISILFLLILFMIFLSPIASLVDSYCYDLMEKHKSIQYGKIRLMGSAGYAIAALIIGIVIKNTSINSAFYTYFSLSIVCIFILKSIAFKGNSKGYKLDAKDLFILVKDKKFFIFILSIILANFSLGSNGNYIAILIQKTGGDVSKLGLLWFVLAMSELPLFFLGNKLLKKFGDINLYTGCLILYSLRFFLNSISTDYITVIIIQLMQGITYPPYLVASMNYINRIVPEKMRTSGITLYSAIGCGLGSFIGNIAGGFILQSSNIFVVFKVMSLSCILALSILVILRKTDTQPLTNLKA